MRDDGVPKDTTLFHDLYTHTRTPQREKQKHKNMTRKIRKQLREQGEIRAANSPFNIFQLAKRVRRATRNGEALKKIITRHTGALATSRHFARVQLAAYGLRRCEQTLRVGVYYLVGHNVPHEGVEASLRALQS